MKTAQILRPAAKSPRGLAVEGDGSRAQVLKRGIGVHAFANVVVRQIGGGNPQPAQRLSPRGFLAWVQKRMHLSGQGSVLGYDNSKAKELLRGYW